MTPYHRTPVFWLATLAACYTAAAGAWAILPPDWKPVLTEGMKCVLAGIGVAIPAAVMFFKRLEAPRARPPAVDDTDEAGA